MGMDPQDTGVEEILPKLEGVAPPDESPSGFWASYFGEAARQTGASRIAFMERKKNGRWEPRESWPAGAALFPAGPEARAEFESLAAEAEESGMALRRYPAGAAWVHLAAVKASGAAGLIVLRLDRASDEEALASAARAAALAALPEIHGLRQSRAKLAGVLDLTLQLETAESFVAAAMLLCNELAAHLHCDRVSLGWVRGRYARLRAVSHGEQFQKNTGIVEALELAMEEALDQDDEVLWPPEAGATTVTRAHADFAAREQARALATLPLRVDDRLAGALCLERDRAFDAEELTQARLIADQVTARLDILELRGRWFGARWMHGLRKAAGVLIGHEHTGAKLLALGAAVALAALAFIHVTYRVRAPFHLECEKLAQLPAPFDGYIEEVHFRSGDAVHAGEILVSLDKRELLQQEAAATAEMHQHVAEKQMAQSADKVADAQIAEAAAEQSRASLDLAELRLQEADIRAPFDGFVVEGDLRERIAAPVKQGEVLLKVAQVSAIHPAVEVSERDVQEINAGARGELAFTSQPQSKFAIRVERVQPVAQDTPQGNIFIADAQFAGPAQAWWRPGMTGVAKIDTQRRSLLWILTHRTVDYLRLKLWW